MVLNFKKDDQWVRIPYLSIATSSSSNIPEAPIDGNQYARQDGEWTVVNIPDITWNNVTDKPTWIGNTKPTYDVSEITNAVSTTDPRLSDKREADGGNADTVNNLTVLTAVPANAKFTDTVYDDTELSNRISGIETNKVDKSEIPTTLPASDVYDWAKAETKPTYNVTEITDAVATTDPRLSDSRSPLQHTHLKADITDFTHTHTKSEITDFPTIPSKTSDITNDSGYITKTVSDLDNYYLKTETATKQAIQELVGEVNTRVDKIAPSYSVRGNNLNNISSEHTCWYAQVTSNQSISINETSGYSDNGRNVTVFVYCGANVTITIPTTGNYISMCGSSYSGTTGKWVEFDFVRIDGKWHIAKLEQE